MRLPQASLSCSISNTDPTKPLGLEIWLDNQLVFDQNHVTNAIHWNHELSEDAGEHQLKFLLKNKTPEHTTIDAQGNITQDACMVITDIRFDDIELGHTFTEITEYCHDFNGTGQPTQQKFYGTMGCNGTVSLKFTTPIYLWLLENL